MLSAVKKAAIQKTISRIFVRIKEQPIEAVLFLCASFSIIILSLMLVFVAKEGAFAFSRFGVDFIIGQVWDTNARLYGAFPLVYSSLMVALGALALALPLAILGCQSTGELGGTSWNAVEVISPAQPDMADLDVMFGADGWLTATITNDNGSKEESRRRYSVFRSLLVIERAEGDLELLHRFEDGQLILTDENFQARMRRTN